MSRKCHVPFSRKKIPKFRRKFNFFGVRGISHSRKIQNRRASYPLPVVKIWSRSVEVSVYLRPKNRFPNGPPWRGAYTRYKYRAKKSPNGVGNTNSSTYSKSWGGGELYLGTATIKLRPPYEVWTNETEQDSIPSRWRRNYIHVPGYPIQFRPLPDCLAVSADQ